MPTPPDASHTNPSTSDAEAFAGEDSGSNPERCPCCNNIWTRPPPSSFAAPTKGAGGNNKASEDFLAKLAAAACATCAPPSVQSKEEEDGGSVGGLLASNRDESVPPSDNFYWYANGGWISANPIPPGYPSWNTVTALQLQSQERCKAILEDLKQAVNDGQ